MKIIKDLAISESGFVFNPITGESFNVNEVGYAIINKLKEGAENSEILSFLLSEFDADPNELEKDFNDFINMLQKNKLLTV